MNTTDDPFLTDVEAAEYFGLSVHTLRNFRLDKQTQRGPAYTKLGFAVRYRRSWLDDYAKKYIQGGATA